MRLPTVETTTSATHPAASVPSLPPSTWLLWSRQPTRRRPLRLPRPRPRLRSRPAPLRLGIRRATPNERSSRAIPRKRSSSHARPPRATPPTRRRGSSSARPTKPPPVRHSPARRTGAVPPRDAATASRSVGRFSLSRPSRVGACGAATWRARTRSPPRRKPAEPPPAVSGRNRRPRTERVPARARASAHVRLAPSDRFAPTPRASAR